MIPAFEARGDEPGRAVPLSSAERAALLDDTVDMLVVLSRDAQLVHANLAASTVLGWSLEDGPRSVISFVHPDDRDFIAETLVQFIDGSTPMGRQRLRIWHAADERWAWIEVMGRDRLGVPRVDGIVVSARDITDQVATEQQVAESEQRFRSLVTASADSVLMVSPDGHVLYASPLAESLFVASGSHMRDLAAVIHPDDVERVREVFRTTRDGEVGTKQDTVLRVPDPDGEWRWIESWIVNQLGVAGVDALVIYGRDITDRRKTEARLRSRVEADDLVARIASRFVEVGADEIDQAVQEALAELGRFCRADRSWIFRLQRDHQRIDYAFEWCAPGVPRAIDELHGVAIADIPGFARWIAEPGPLMLRSLSDLPGELTEERAILDAQDIKSIAMHAMIVKGEAYGIIGLDAVDDEVEWPEAVRFALGACANIFGSALRRSEAEEALAMSEARFRAMFEQAADGVRVLDADLRTIYSSPAVTRFTGYGDDDLSDPGVRLLLVHPDDRHVIEEARDELLGNPGRTVVSSYRMLRPDGTWVHLEEASTNLLHDPAVRGVVINVRDTTERHAYEAELLDQARRDALTKLPNRRLFEELVEAALARRRLSGAGLAVLWLDLDRFKLINDSLGHRAGDAILLEAVRRIRAVLRGGDVVARLGGDEFAVLCEPVDPDEIAEIAESIVERFRRPFEVDGQHVYATATVGIATGSEVLDGDDLMRAADGARQSAKHAGGNRALLFGGQLADSARERVDLEAGLRRAVEAGELRVHYQPIVHLATGTFSGAEALVRWDHPERDGLGPNAFLDVAEHTGLIIPIGEWVLSEAARVLAEWVAADPASEPVMHVNVSVRQLAAGGVADAVERAIAEHGLRPSSFCIEITESTLLAGKEPVAELSRIQRAGVRVALDDFGTGHSSLAYLRHLELDTLKIDRQFVDGLTAGGSDAVIVEAIIRLARSLGLSTVAEGVETPEQLEALRALGCDEVQGFWFSEALPADVLSELVATRPDGL